MLVGQTIGPFAIEKELGSGAMGTVYLARYTKTNQRVALKVMAPGLGTKDKAVARFEREAAILKQLNHPNIVRFFGAGKFHGTPFYAMEYIEGESLDHVLSRRGRHTWEEVVVLGQQLCSALQRAHQQGIIHRDLKPSNLMLLRDGSLKLTDFGIAKDLDVTQLTSANCTVGTASYMSPEQCRGERDLTHKSDLYSLGVVFYELLTGRKPFLAENAMDMFLMHVQGTFERPSRLVLEIPVWLDTLVCQLLEKKPEHRPRDADAVAEALNRIAEKVAAQQSAGLDAAKTRAIDRTPGTRKPADETDKEVARTLLHGRRKRRTVPFYQRLWFQILGIAALLGAFGGVLYLVMRPPSEDALFAQAQKLMQSSQFDDHVKAREEAINDFLHRYGDRNDEQCRQIQTWADEVDCEQRERSLYKRMKLFAPQDKAEAVAREAVNYEDTGELGAARDKWQAILKSRDNGDAVERSEVLLAEKHLRILKEADDRFAQLSDKIAEARVHKEKTAGDTDYERLAVSAWRYEQFGDVKEAAKLWDELKDKAKEDSHQRSWFLLANNHFNDLKSKKNAPSAKEVIERNLDQAEAVFRSGKHINARTICLDVIALYGDNPELNEQVNAARQRYDKYSFKPQIGTRGEERGTRDERRK